MFGYLDCSSGVSGDKFLGAVVDAGASLDSLRDALADMPLHGYSLSVGEVLRGGLRATLVTVSVDEEQPLRSYHDIERLIGRAILSETARLGVSRTFALLAEAEARVHGVTIDDVHFHEVGAVDSIVDIVGTAVGLAELGVEDLWATPVCVGSGTVETAHGTLPVPAPATAQLLEGVPTYAGATALEMTTPTGAALLRAFVSRYAPAPPAETIRLGFGAGRRDPEGISNVLRISLAERGDWDGIDEQVVLLETAIDHLSPEHLAVALEFVMEAGALDVWQRPVVMKKGRLAVEVTVMARPSDAPRLTAELMSQTGTLGVRRTEVWRSVAKRRASVVATEFGQVRTKTGDLGSTQHTRAESADVARIAREIGEGVADVAKRLSRSVGASEAQSGTE